MITCTFEDGGTGALRHVTVDTIILNEGSIALVKRAARLVEGGKWALPGGYVDRDETITQAAIREALEETGFKVNNLQLMTIKDRPDRPGDDRQNISFVFIATAAEKTGEADDESDDMQWFPLDELPPNAQIAFDHLDIIKLFKRHLEKPFSTPILG